VALPVLAGASLLQGVRLLRAGVPRRLRFAFAAGAASAFGSTLASAALVRRRRLAERGLAPFAAYRVVLATSVLVRARRAG
jgi:undecaprenyl pyrophosphate phosphatase UppP